MTRPNSGPAVLFALLGSVGCGGKDEGAAANTPAYASVICTGGATHCADGSANGKRFYAGFLAAGTTCASFTGREAVAFVRGPVNCSGGSCTGSSTTGFLAATGGPAAAPAPGTYSMYNYIDTNGNTDPDKGEPRTCSDSINWDGKTVAITINSNDI